MKENEKVMNFNEDAKVENENTEAAEVVVEKQGLRKKIHDMPTWKKVLIGGAVIGVAVVGGKKIVQVLSKKPEVVAEVVDAVAENSPEIVEEAKAV